MRRRLRRSMLAAGLASLLVAQALPAFAAGNDFNEKGEFENVTFSNGVTGTLYAGSKQTNGSTFTTCEFQDSDGTYLGRFETGEFASADSAEDFCLTNFNNRVQ